MTVLSVVLSRIYTLRNQLMHGGATWSSSVNRDQIRDWPSGITPATPAIPPSGMGAACCERLGDPSVPYPISLSDILWPVRGS